MTRHSLRVVGVTGLGLTGVPAGAAAQLAQRPADQYIERMERPDRVVKVREVIEKLRLESRKDLRAR